VLSVVVSADTDIDGPASLRCLLEFAADRLPEFPAGSWDVTVRLADEEEIVSLHDRFFGIPANTDVMSFPSGEVERSSGALGGYLGDIAISVLVSAEQAIEHGHSHAREICFLALHGLLHLVGHDDGTPEERDAMLWLQSSLIDAYEANTGRKL
jgi:probable rRNA maturation factor